MYCDFTGFVFCIRVRYRGIRFNTVLLFYFILLFVLVFIIQNVTEFSVLLMLAVCNVYLFAFSNAFIILSTLALA